ncbi:metalloreductase STEAP3-like [Amphibalanus amphitrite]|uniref:metalloreductase STEAP3-like n=1 Tax=Amphibalanus amphitrite TaxID=1232801 RepID=UPI001C90E00C|nr:metalloreductase STEAP3-like [Amphibalanus amphitrite]
MPAHRNPAFSADPVTETPADLEMTSPGVEGRRLCVLGSGDFGRAIARRAVLSGFAVKIGTRSKEKQEDLLRLIEATGASVTTQADAVNSSELVVVCISRRFYDSLPLQLLANKVLIDVSNPDDAVRKSPISNAEYLQQLVPSALVVKALNILSAYSLETGGMQGSKEVPIATDSDIGRAKVTQLVRDMGFTPVDLGPLRQSRYIEAVPMEFFNSWRGAFIVVSVLFLVGYVLNFIKFQLCHNMTKNKTWDWSVFKQILMTNFNRNLGVVALTTLGAIYLAGIIAGFMQLYRGTKYSRFPRWLDNWLRMRKQLGLLMLAMGATHGCMSLGIYHPHHQYDWLFEPPKTIRAEVKINGTFEIQEIPLWRHDPNWRGEVFLTLGAVTLCLLAILGIASLPSVTDRLTWREFAFIQSKLGWTALVAGSLHNLVLGWDYMLKAYDCYFPTGLQYALYLPLLCLIGKLVLLVPRVNRRLMDIRSGEVKQPLRRAARKRVSAA